MVFKITRVYTVHCTVYRDRLSSPLKDGSLHIGDITEVCPEAQKTQASPGPGWWTPCETGVRLDGVLALDPVHHVEVAHLILPCWTHHSCPISSVNHRTSSSNDVTRC